MTLSVPSGLYYARAQLQTRAAPVAREGEIHNEKAQRT